MHNVQQFNGKIEKCLTFLYFHKDMKKINIWHAMQVTINISDCLLNMKVYCRLNINNCSLTITSICKNLIKNFIYCAIHLHSNIYVIFSKVVILGFLFAFLFLFCNSEYICLHLEQEHLCLRHTTLDERKYIWYSRKVLKMSTIALNKISLNIFSVWK